MAELYSDPSVIEIMVDACDRIYVERHAKELEDVPASFGSPEALRATIDTVLALGGVELSAEKTTGEVLFLNGVRFLAVLPPWLSVAHERHRRRAGAGRGDLSNGQPGPGAG